MKAQQRILPKRVVLILALIVSVFVSPAYASRAVRVGPEDNLPALLADMPDNMLVIFEPGTYRLSLTLTGRRLFFEAPEGGVLITPDSQPFVLRLEEGSEIALDNIDLRSEAPQTATVIVQDATLDLVDARITNKGGPAIYARGRLEAEGARIEGRGMAAVRITGGDGAILRGTEIVNAGGGTGIVVQDSKAFLMDGGEVRGNTAVLAQRLTGRLELKRSLLFGTGKAGTAMLAENIPALDVIESALVGEKIALSGRLDDGDIWQVDSSLLAATSATVRLSGRAGADFRFDVSMAVSTGVDSDGGAFTSEGAGFVPLMESSLLLAKGGSALVIRQGAAALVARTVVASTAGSALTLVAHDPVNLTLASSLLYPLPSANDLAAPAMDEETWRLGRADPEYSKQAVTTLINEIVDALENRPPETIDSALALLESYDIDFSLLRDTLRGKRP